MPHYLKDSFSASENNFTFAKSLNNFLTYIETLCTSELKIALYGAGTVTKLIAKLYSDSIEVIIDKNNYGYLINNINVDNLNNINKYSFDIILITPLGREVSIIEELTEIYKINHKKIRVFEILTSTNMSQEEKSLIIKNHQKNMSCNFNIAPYKIDYTTKILNLIFFMGIGDYLFVTPVLKQLKLSFPKIEINAYVSRNTDNFNSALVYDMLIQDKNIDKVIYYDGKVGFRWETYNYKNAIEQINSEDNTIYPMVFNHMEKESIHRVNEVYKTFNLSIRNTPKPILYFQKINYKSTKNESDYINSLDKEVVFLHLEARHCSYSYKKYNELIGKLIDNNLFVIFISPKLSLNNFNKNSFLHLDITLYKIYESLAFINSINKRKYMIAINSVMLHVSSALDIPALGLYIFKDSTQTRQTFYNNIHVLTIDEECYNFLPKENVSLINENEIQIIDGYIAEYPPNIIFNKFVSLVLHQ